MKNIWKIPLVKIIFIAVLAWLVFNSARELKSLSTSFLPDWLVSDHNSMNAIFKTLLALISILIMLLTPDKKLKDFGICLPKKFDLLKLTGLTVAVTWAGMVIFGLIYMGILSGLFQVEMSGGFDTGSSVWVMIIGVWFWSSVTEEIFHRGLLQSLLKGLEKYCWAGLSLTAWISALLFGAAHFSVFKISSSPFFVMMIVSNTTVLGLIAAGYREKTGSILPAVIAHILANVAGSLPSFFIG